VSDCGTRNPAPAGLPPGARTAGRAGRRPTRPHVRARRAAAWVPHGGAGPRPPPARPGPRPTNTCARLRRPRVRWPSWPALRAVTTEFENVPAACAAARWRHRAVSPPADAVAVCQHRAAEKAHFAAAGVPCAPHAVLSTATADLRPCVSAALLPGILKTASAGLRRQGPAPRDRRRVGGCLCGAGRRALRAGAAPAPGGEISVVVARGATAAMGAPAGAAEPAPRRHPGRHPGAAPDVERRCRGRRPAHGRPAWPPRCSTSACCASSSSCWPTAAAGQRDGAAPAQLGPLQHRRLRRVAVRAAGAHAGGPAAGAAAPALAGGDAQPAGRPVVRRRPTAQPHEPDWAAVLALPGVHLHLYGKAEPRAGARWAT
jgi:5-(carboxyamino)imidazole ribonucleotide synthase